MMGCVDQYYYDVMAAYADLATVPLGPRLVGGPKLTGTCVMEVVVALVGAAQERGREKLGRVGVVELVWVGLWFSFPLLQPCCVLFMRGHSIFRADSMYCVASACGCF